MKRPRNVNFTKGQPFHKPIPPPPPNAKGTIVNEQGCVLGTGWNITTNCTVCMKNWKNENGLCNECAENHYGPMCRQCKCAVYDHSFELANEERFLDCNEGVHGDGTCSIVSEVNVFFWVVSSILGVVVIIKISMIIYSFVI